MSSNSPTSAPDPTSPDPQWEQAKALLLARGAEMQQTIAQGRRMPVPAETQPPDWEAHAARLAEWESAVRESAGREEYPRLEKMRADFMRDFEADLAPLVAAVNEQLMRAAGEIAQRAMGGERPPQS